MPENFRVVGLHTPDKRALRAGIWDVPSGQAARGVCVLLQGLTEFLEKYDEVARELNARGFTVASVDWRSQGASERRGYGTRRGHVSSFEEYDHDLGILVQHVLGNMGPQPMIALAHSMGAHILLRYLHEHKRRFACAVLSAPMLEVDTGDYSPWLTHALTLAMNLRRPSTRFVFGTEERDPLTLPFEQNRVTSDRERYWRAQELLVGRPYLAINGPTFGWLGAALRSMRQLKRPRFAKEIATPLLVFGAGKDRIVHSSATRAFVKRLPDARYVEFEDAEHEILMEKDSIRARFWSEFDTFVDAHVPFPAP